MSWRVYKLSPLGKGAQKHPRGARLIYHKTEPGLSLYALAAAFRMLVYVRDKHKRNDICPLPAFFALLAAGNRWPTSSFVDWAAENDKRLLAIRGFKKSGE